jgi:hypothetical protein
LAGDPDFGQAIDRVERTRPGDHLRQVHRPGTAVPALALSVLLVAGPRLLTENDVARRRRSPAPRRSSVASQPAASLEYATNVHIGRMEKTRRTQPHASTDLHGGGRQ